MKYSIYLLIFSVFVLLSFQSCEIKGLLDEADYNRQNDLEIQDYIAKNNLQAQGTGSGLFYAITQSSDGQTAQEGDSLQIHFVARLISGTIVDSTSEIRKRPDNALLGNTSLINGLVEGLTLMKEGENATLLIPSYLGLGGGSTALIPPYSVLIYQLKLINVRNNIERLLEYATKNNFNPIPTGTGLYTSIQQVGTGLQTATGDSLTLAYTGKLVNGKVFDSSTDYQIVLGTSQLIDGFTEGLALMKEGEKRILLMPWQLAYGKEGQRDPNTNAFIILPYEPLVFEVELKKVKKP